MNNPFTHSGPQSNSIFEAAYTTRDFDLLITAFIVMQAHGRANKQ